MSATKKLSGAGTGLLHRSEFQDRLDAAWPWPRAALAILGLSLLLWGMVAGIVSLAFR